MPNANVFGSHKNFIRGQKEIPVDFLNDLINLMKGVGGMDAVAPLRLQKTRTGWVLSLTKKPETEKHWIAHAASDIQPETVVDYVILADEDPTRPGKWLQRSDEPKNRLEKVQHDGLKKIPKGTKLYVQEFAGRKRIVEAFICTK